jgi:hypothetical protein
MDKYIKTAEATVRTMEAIAAMIILVYGVIWFERWQRPEEVKREKEKSSYSVDTIKKI